MNEKVSRPVAIATAAAPAVAAGSWPFAARRRLAALGWLLTLAAGLGAAVPVIAATVDAVRVGWVPAADQAIIATRAYDVFTSHMPLDGQYTTAWVVTGHLVRDLGPMLYWLVALPARFGSAASITVTMGAANTLAIIGCVALARRRGGLVLMFATAAAIAVMCRSLAAETFHDVWTASAGLFPCMLLIFLCWSLACGDHRLLPLSMLVASYVAQAHLMYVAPALGLLVVGLAGVAVSRRPRFARWALAALIVAGVCWTPTVVDEVTHHPGNLTRVLDTDAAPRHGRREQRLARGRAGDRSPAAVVGIRPGLAL